MIVRKNIKKAILNKIYIERVTINSVDVEEIITTIKIKAEGNYVDEDNSIVVGEYPARDYEWDDIPQQLKNNLKVILRIISRDFNKEFADEDTETFEINYPTTI